MLTLANRILQEKTSGQAMYDTSSPMSALFGGTPWGNNLPGYVSLPGYNTEFPGSYPNYRKMSSNPTLAMAKAIKTTPIMAAGWSWMVREGLIGGDIILKFVKDQLEPIRPQVLDDMMMALDMGNQSFELVFEQERTTDPILPSTAFVVRKIKALLQDITRVRVTRKTASFDGLDNNGVHLATDECFHYIFGMRAGNYYGRSLHENCRAEFRDFELDTIERQKLTRKISGIIPIAKVLRGLVKDPKTGLPIDRFAQMQKVIAGLALAKGIVFESLALNADDVRNNPELIKTTDVDLSTLDVGNQGPALSSLLAQRQAYQSEFMMAWLLPPRTALEGTHGTLAEAEAHANIGIAHSELLHQHACTMLNWHVIDKLLALNFGDEMRGAVWIEPAPIVDFKKEVLKQILTAILANPATFEMLLMDVDTDQVYDRLDIPKKKSVAGGPDPEPDPSALLPPEPDPAALPTPPGGPSPSARAAIGRVFSRTQIGAAQ